MRVQLKSLQICLLSLVIASTTLFSGCVPWAKGLRSIDETVTDWRDFVWGKRAFFRRYGRNQSKPFRDGFIEGYHDMLQGGDGCVPVVPPRRYWSWRYQSAGGQTAITDWFEGYRAGVTAAKEDGLDNLSKVPIASNYNGMNDVPVQMMPGTDIGVEYLPVEDVTPNETFQGAPNVEPLKAPEVPTLDKKTQLPNSSSELLSKKSGATKTLLTEKWTLEKSPSFVRPVAQTGQSKRATAIPTISKTGRSNVNNTGSINRPVVEPKFSLDPQTILALPQVNSVSVNNPLPHQRSTVESSLSEIRTKSTDDPKSLTKQPGDDEQAPMIRVLPAGSSESKTDSASTFSLPPILPALPKEAPPLPSSASSILR